MFNKNINKTIIVCFLICDRNLIVSFQQYHTYRTLPRQYPSSGKLIVGSEGQNMDCHNLDEKVIYGSLINVAKSFLERMSFRCCRQIMIRCEK